MNIEIGLSLTTDTCLGFEDKQLLQKTLPIIRIHWFSASQFGLDLPLQLSQMFIRLSL